MLVGDIGDNEGVRSSVRLLSVPVGRGERQVAPTAYDVVYADGPQDAETLLVQPRTGRVLIVTKGLLGGRILAPDGDPDAELDPDGVTEMSPVGEAIALATDGAFFPDGRHFVVRNYGGAALYTYPGLEQVAQLDLPEQQQGEGIAVDERGRVYLSSEGAGSDVLRLSLPPRVQRLLTPPSSPSSTSKPPLVREQPTFSGPQWPWLAAGIALLLIVVSGAVLVGLAVVLVLRRAGGRRSSRG